MIIDLDLSNRAVVVLGGGNQAERRVKAVLQEKRGARITVLSASPSDRIREWAREGKVRLIHGDVQDGSFIDDHNPDIVIAATNDPGINDMAVSAARKKAGGGRILAYRSDDHTSSDFSHPSVIRLDGGVTVAVFTGGQSPAVSMEIRRRAEAVLRGIVTPETVAQLRIQDAVRRKARAEMPAQAERKRLLDDIMADRAVDRLIRDGLLKEAEERAMSMLRGRL